MTDRQLDAYRRMPFSARLDYLVRIGEARDMTDALSKVNARRRAYRERAKAQSQAMARARREQADRVAAIYG